MVANADVNGSRHILCVYLYIIINIVLNVYSSLDIDI